MHNQIKSYRQKIGLTQSQFADAMGVGQPTVSNYENGGRTVDIDGARVLVRTFKLFGLSLTLEDLFPIEQAA